jgi:hypothetical protein
MALDETRWLDLARRIRGRAPALARSVMVIAVGLTLLVAAALTWYAHPNGDDFCVGVDVRELGWAGCVERSYRLEGGRWAGYAVTCGLKGVASLSAQYPLGPLLMLALCVLATRFLLGSLLPTETDRRSNWLLAVFFVALYWAGLPHPGETFYWLDSAQPYLLSVLLAMVVVGALVRIPEQLSIRQGPVVVALGLLAAFVVGLHEIIGLALVGVLVVGAGVARLQADRRQLAWAAVAAMALLSFAAVFLAPGNEIRARGAQPSERTLMGAALAALQMWLRVLDAPVAREVAPGSHGTPLGWVLDPRLLTATILFATSARMRRLRSRWTESAPELWKTVVPLVSIAILAGSFFAGGWALGRALPFRVMNALYLVFLLGWFLTVFVYTRSASLDARASGLPLLQTASALLLALGLLFSTNFKLGARDLAKGWASHYDRQMTLRYEEAARLAARGGGDLVVDEIVPWPRSYYRNEIREDPDALQNRCVADYLGIDSIRLVPASAEGARSETASPTRQPRQQPS